MKIFNWFQSKINGKYKKKSMTVTNHMLHQQSKEEFIDWPNELLAIGTFGNNTLKDPENLNHSEEPTPDQEVVDLHKELKLLLHDSDSAKGSRKDLEKFFDCLMNLEDDNTTICGCRILENTTCSSGIVKKSVTCLLKKAFLSSRGGFIASPSRLLRDPISQSKFEKLRIIKILRAILHKKLYSKASSPRANIKKYLDNRYVVENDSDNEAFEPVNDGSKWDKSDSEFIVLEM